MMAATCRSAWGGLIRPERSTGDFIGQGVEGNGKDRTTGGIWARGLLHCHTNS